MSQHATLRRCFAATLLLAAFPAPLAASPQDLLGSRTIQRDLGDRQPFERRLLVVDAFGQGDYIGIQPAIDAARGGDLIVVRDRGTSYGFFGIEGKGVHLVGTGGRPVGTEVYARDIPADEPLSIRNFQVGLSPCQDIASTFWVEDVASEGSNAFRMTRVADAVVVRSNFSTVWFFFPNQDGIALITSSAHLYETTATGGNGGSCSYIPGNGGDGVFADSTSFLLAYASQLTGGAAGSTYTTPTFDCVPLSPGLSFRGQSGSVAYELETAFPSGISGNIDDFLGVTRTLEMPALVTDRELAHATITGSPGSTVWLLRAPRPDIVFSTLLYGTVVGGASPITTAIGTIPASGILEVDVPLPALEADEPFRSWYMQTLQNDGIAPYISSPSLVHVVPEGVL